MYHNVYLPIWIFKFRVANSEESGIKFENKNRKMRVSFALNSCFMYKYYNICKSKTDYGVKSN